MFKVLKYLLGFIGLNLYQSRYNKDTYIIRFGLDYWRNLYWKHKNKNLKNIPELDEGFKLFLESVEEHVDHSKKEPIPWYNAYGDILEFLVETDIRYYAHPVTKKHGVDWLLDTETNEVVGFDVWIVKHVLERAGYMVLEKDKLEDLKDRVSRYEKLMGKLKGMD